MTDRKAARAAAEALRGEGRRLETIGWIPCPDPRSDALMQALAKMELPPVALVRAAGIMGAGNAGQIEPFYGCWAVAVACMMHVQTPPGERFANPTVEEASRYVGAGLPCWWADSKGKEHADRGTRNGGATRLMQSGFMPWTYGEKYVAKVGVPKPGGGTKWTPAQPRRAREGRQYEFHHGRHLWTNDASRGAGRRVVATGGPMLRALRGFAARLRYWPLRAFFEGQIALAEARALRPAREVAALGLPGHHRYVAKLIYGMNRQLESSKPPGDRGYLCVVAKGETLAWLRERLFVPGADAGEQGRNVNVLMVGRRTLRLRAGPGGWAQTAQGQVQVSTLARANVPPPERKDAGPSAPDVYRYANVPVAAGAPGELLIEVPADLFAMANRAGDGNKTRTSGGSAPGRAKTLQGDRPRVSRRDAGRKAKAA